MRRSTFIAKSENLLITGSTGSDKSYLAVLIKEKILRIFSELPTKRFIAKVGKGEAIELEWHFVKEVYGRSAIYNNIQYFYLIFISMRRHSAVRL